MFYALKDEFGNYVSIRSKLSGGYLYITYTSDMYRARTFSEKQAIRSKTIINKAVSSTNTGFNRPRAYDDDKNQSRPIIPVNIVRLKLTEEEEEVNDTV